jgi:hypothetical protein
VREIEQCCIAIGGSTFDDDDDDGDSDDDSDSDTDSV